MFRAFHYMRNLFKILSTKKVAKKNPIKPNTQTKNFVTGIKCLSTRDHLKDSRNPIILPASISKHSFGVSISIVNTDDNASSQAI
jgi:hypothetical protein